MLLDASRARRPPNAAGKPVILRTIFDSAIDLGLDAQTQRVFTICTTCRPNDVGTVTTLDAQSGAVIRTVPVGSFPDVVGIDERTSRAFVADDQGVAMLDARTGRVLRTIRLTGSAKHIAVAVSTGHVFVTGTVIHDQYTVISMLDARSGAVLHQTRWVGNWTVSAVDERAGRVGVTSFETTGGLDLLDARTGALVRTVKTKPSPYVAAVDEQNDHLFLAESDPVSGSYAQMFDARSGALLRTTPININPTTAAVDAQTQRVFITTLYTVDVLDARTGALVHSTTTATAAQSVPVPLLKPEVVVLLPSPTDEQGTPTGPAYLLALDGRIGVVRRRVNIGNVQPSSIDYDSIVVDARNGHGFVLNGQGVTMFDATRL